MLFHFNILSIKHIILIFVFFKYFDLIFHKNINILIAFNLKQSTNITFFKYK